MKIPNLLKLLISIVFCMSAGIIGSFFTISSIPNWYMNLNKPIFAPPNWLFGPVWTLLYILMGISLYLVWIKLESNPNSKKAIKIFLLQLGLNFIWTPVFFGLRSPLFGLLIIIALLISIVVTMKSFFTISKVAMYLLIPYLLWVSFATILNAAIYWLN